VLFGATAAPIQAVARSHSARHHGHHAKGSHGESKGGHGHSKGGHGHRATVALHKKVRRPGLYSVRVVITWPLHARHGAVQLKIGKDARRVRARGRRRATVVDATVSVHGRVLTIDETRLRGRPKLRFEAKRIGALPTAPKPPVPATPGLTAGSSSSTAGSSGSSAAGGPAGDPGTWNLAFDDEFTGSSLDTSKWSVGWFGSGITKAVNSYETACYDPSHVSEANGELDLTLTAGSTSCGGATQPYDGAAVTTNGHFQFTYGFVEVRAWLAGNGSSVYDWPQIWLDGQNWPADGEIDILEGLGGSACYHWHGPPSGTGYGGCPAGNFSGGWHTFGVDWEPGSVTYYYDGTNVGSVTNSTSQITGDPMYLILVASTSAESPSQAATEQFDYVRVWQH
jgi:beta-glucanase (GH16 family)